MVKIIYILISLIIAISIMIFVAFLYYYIGLFLSNEPNMMEWPWYGKVLYLLFCIGNFTSIINGIKEYSQN